MATHIAFGDESHWSEGRFRSISLVTLEMNEARNLHLQMANILEGKTNKDIGWKSLYRNADKKRCIQYINLLPKYLDSNSIRIDTLIYDMENPRHANIDIDNPKNFGIMYFHLFNHVFSKKWPSNLSWIVYPDQHTQLDWQKLEECINFKSIQAPTENGLDYDNFDSTYYLDNVRKKYRIEEIKQADSKKHFIVHIADLFSGSACFLFENTSIIENWKDQYSCQGTLDLGIEENVDLKRAVKNKAELTNSIIELCKQYKYSICQDGGISTRNPKDSINFWLYTPKSELDKAPVKEAYVYCNV